MFLKPCLLCWDWLALAEKMSVTEAENRAAIVPPFAFILIGAPLKARRVPLTVPILISVIAFQSGEERKSATASGTSCHPLQAKRRWLWSVPAIQSVAKRDGGPSFWWILTHIQEVNVAPSWQVPESHKRAWYCSCTSIYYRSRCHCNLGNVGVNMGLDIPNMRIQFKEASSEIENRFGS